MGIYTSWLKAVSGCTIYRRGNRQMVIVPNNKKHKFPKSSNMGKRSELLERNFFLGVEMIDGNIKGIVTEYIQAYIPKHWPDLNEKIEWLD